jgi:hypothetical protein
MSLLVECWLLQLSPIVLLPFFLGRYHLRNRRSTYRGVMFRLVRYVFWPLVVILCARIANFGAVEVRSGHAYHKGRLFGSPTLMGYRNGACQ